MRRVIDRTSKGELWMEVTANLAVYHIEGADGYHVATNRASVAKAEWAKLNARGPEKQGAPI